MIRSLLAILILWLAPASIAWATTDVVMGPIVVCPVAPETGACRVTIPGEIGAPPGQAVLARAVTVDKAAVGVPLVVRITAMASSEVSWNGVVIGRNGAPGADRTTEAVGRFRAEFTVPADAVRPGRNILSARVSSQHLFLPVAEPIHQFEVARAGEGANVALQGYLPALMVGGLLAAMGAGFVGLHLMDRTRRGALILAGVAVLGLLQLTVETSRAFANYPYPWQVGRLVLIAVLAGAAAVVAARYAAWRFTPSRRGLVTALTGAGVVAMLIVTPGFDYKTAGSLLLGLLAVLACAAAGVRGRRPGARPAAVAAVLALLLLLGLQGGFLDAVYYLTLAVILLVLLVEQVLSAWRAPPSMEVTATQADVRAPPSSGSIKVADGRRTRLIATDDVMRLTAADDYCHIGLTDGRTLLHGATLAETLAQAPDVFLRVHRSHAVNPKHLDFVATRPGGGRVVVLTQGDSAPVGRTYRDAVLAWLSGQATGPRN